MKKARPSKKRTGAATSSTSAGAARSATSRESHPENGTYQDIRRDLERQREAILNETGEVLTHREDIEAFPDVSDQASAEVDQNFSMRIRDRERKLLKKIDEALGRMDADTYGKCELCGGEIPYKRLKARPVTTLCIECKTLQEQEEQARR
ncbi:MAG: RNA polymerase-binding protein DksA [Nitrospira sp.]